MTIRILLGHTLDRMRELPAKSVQTCVTSPPYYGLRSYVEDGSPLKEFEIGLEVSPLAFLDKLVEVFEEVKRVLRDDGTLWINMGDSYAGSWGAQGRRESSTNGSSLSRNQIKNHPKFARRTGSRMGGGFKPKDRMMIPARLAIALCDAGWYLRDEIVWAKPNPMPMSMKDRTTPAHEMLYLFSKRRRYYYDADAIAEPLTEASIVRLTQKTILDQNGGPRQDSFEGIATTGTRRPNRILHDLSNKLMNKPVTGWASGSSDHSAAGHTAALPRSGNKRRKTGEERGRPDSHLAGSVPWEAGRPQYLRALEIAEEAGLTAEHIDAIRACGLTDTGRGKIVQTGAGRNLPEVQRLADEARAVLGSYAREFTFRQRRANKRSVWTVPTYPFPGQYCTACARYYEGEDLGALRIEKIKEGDGERTLRYCACGSHDAWLSHFATFPPALIEPCILASTSEYGACAHCGAPWVRVVERAFEPQTDVSTEAGVRGAGAQRPMDASSRWDGFPRGTTSARTLDWAPSCKCDEARIAPCVVLDPFAGTGTTGLVAHRAHRSAVLIEINPHFADMARQRVAHDGGMFAEVVNG